MATSDQFLSVIVKHGGSDLHFAENTAAEDACAWRHHAIAHSRLSREEAVQMMSEICGAQNWE